MDMFKADYMKNSVSDDVSAIKAVKGTSCAYGDLFNSYETRVTVNADEIKIKGYSLVDKIDNIEKHIKPKDVSEETKTELVSEGNNLNIKYYKDGYYQSKKVLMSDIADVRTAGNAVFVTFADGSFTKAILDKEDGPFNLEQGISICLTKKLIGENGSSIYNKLIQKALKVKKQKELDAEKAAKKKEEEKKKLAKDKAKREKRKAKKREETIEIHREAFVRAMRDLAMCGNEDDK